MKGRDLVSGLPKTVTLRATRCAQAIEEPLRAIIETIKETLERTPPELAADVAQRGIMLAGGGSLLRGFDERRPRGDEDARVPRRLAADLRGARLRPLARGVRSDAQRRRRPPPPGQPTLAAQSAAASRASWWRMRSRSSAKRSVS